MKKIMTVVLLATALYLAPSLSPAASMPAQIPEGQVLTQQDMAEAEALQAYLDQSHDDNITAGKDWTQSRGLLGWTTQGSIIAGSVFYHLILIFIVGGIHGKKEYGKWWTPFNSRFVFELGKAVVILNKAWTGITTPKPYIATTDGQIIRLHRFALASALDHASGRMMKEGWTVSSYIKGARDCDKFVKRKISYAQEYIERHSDAEGRGTPFSLFGYTRDDGVPHAIIRAQDEHGNSEFYEGYAEAKYMAPMKLSRSELESMDVDFR